MSALATFVLALQLPLEMSVGDYRDELARIASLIRSRDVAAAQAAALNLEHVAVAGTIAFVADDTLLKPIVQLKPEQSPSLVLARLDAAIQSFEGPAGIGPNPRASDRQALATIRKSWDLELEEGRVDLHLVKTRDPPDWLIDRIAEAFNAIARWVNAVWKWLFGEAPQGKETGMGAAEASVALVALACGVFALLAYRAFRMRRRRPAVTVAPDEVESDRDDDPTSRQPSEWEQHAEALANAGRYREAIRAWYHAVLAATFSRGYVAYAKGRTNWEYVAALSPGLRFRNDVVSMTQRFEGCWYGGRDADERALFAQKRTAQAVLVLLTSGVTS